MLHHTVIGLLLLDHVDVALGMLHHTAIGLLLFDHVDVCCPRS